MQIFPVRFDEAALDEDLLLHVTLRGRAGAVEHRGLIEANGAPAVRHIACRDLAQRRTLPLDRRRRAAPLQLSTSASLVNAAIDASPPSESARRHAKRSHIPQ